MKKNNFQITCKPYYNLELMVSTESFSVATYTDSNPIYWALFHPGVQPTLLYSTLGIFKKYLSFANVIYGFSAITGV